MALYIKQDVDLKELEKYGFTYQPKHLCEHNSYFKKVYLANENDDVVCHRINPADRIIRITRLDGELDNTLYDLIKADIVIKE